MACRASRQTRHVTISFACKKLHNTLSVARQFTAIKRLGMIAVAAADAADAIVLFDTM